MYWKTFCSSVCDEAVSTDDPAALRRALCTVTGEGPTRRALQVVVDRCHRMACAYLRRQQQAGALREDVLGEDVDDLAIDAIAGLFERDDRGGSPELRRYFADRDLAATDPSAVEQDLRRLVLGTVSDWLFETYRSADRSLSNLIRALKRAADSLDDVHLRRREQTLWLQVRNRSSPSHESAPSRSSAPGRRMPLETLEAHLCPSNWGDRPVEEGRPDGSIGPMCPADLGRLLYSPSRRKDAITGRWSLVAAIESGGSGRATRAEPSTRRSARELLGSR